MSTLPAILLPRMRHGAPSAIRLLGLPPKNTRPKYHATALAISFPAYVAAARSGRVGILRGNSFLLCSRAVASHHGTGYPSAGTSTGTLIMQPNLMEQIEQAVALLRRQGPDTWRYYVLGMVPFVLAVLSFVRDMTSGYGSDRCLAESILCAAAFMWLSFCKSRFSGALVASLAHARPVQSTWYECAVVQLPAQSLKLLALPFAFFTLLPIPWSLALFRALNYEASKRGVTLRSAWAQAARQAATGTKQMTGGLMILFAAAVLAFANFTALVFALPWLLRMVTGAESEWTRNSSSHFPLFCIAAALAWLFIDPVSEAYSAVRCFQFEANSDGRDLLVKIRKVAATAVVLFVMSGISLRAANTVAADGLSHRIDHVIATDQEYRWAHSNHAMEPPNSLAARIVDGIQHGLSKADAAMDHFFDWFGKLFKPEHQGASTTPKHSTSRSNLWWLLAVLAGLVMGIVFFAIRRLGALPVVARQAPVHPPSDIDNSALEAGDRADTEWLQIAGQHSSSGDFRLAVRAIYLANLSYFGAQQSILLARSKTNGMYERELRLRARNSGALQSFIRTNRGYERVWFGEHPASAELVTEFENEARAIRSHA